MSNRTFWSVAAVLGIVILVLANPRTPEETVVHAPDPAEEVAAAAADPPAEQAPAEPASEAEPSADPADWTAPRTPWGDPDLQGVWTNATLTPIERPADLGDQAVLTGRGGGRAGGAVGGEPRRLRPVHPRQRRRLQPVLDGQRQERDRGPAHRAHHGSARRADSVDRGGAGAARERPRAVRGWARSIPTRTPTPASAA